MRARCTSLSPCQPPCYVLATPTLMNTIQPVSLVLKGGGGGSSDSEDHNSGSEGESSDRESSSIKIPRAAAIIDTACGVPLGTEGSVTDNGNGIYTFVYDDGDSTMDLGLHQFKYTDVPAEASEQIEELRKALQAEQSKQQQLRHQRVASQMEAEAVNQVQAEELQRMREELEASNRLVRQLKQQRHQDATSDEEDAQDTRKTLEMQGDKSQHVPVIRQKRCCKVGTGITYLTEVLTMNPDPKFAQLQWYVKTCPPLARALEQQYRKP